MTMQRGRPGAGAALDVKTASVDLATTGGGATEDAVALIPAGCFLIGVTTEIIDAISGSGLTSFDLGDGTDVDVWGATLPLGAGSLTDQTDFTADGFAQFTVANLVRLTANGTVPQFDAGLIRITAHYIQIFS